MKITDISIEEYIAATHRHFYIRTLKLILLLSFIDSVLLCSNFVYENAVILATEKYVSIPRLANILIFTNTAVLILIVLISVYGYIQLTKKTD